MATVQQQQSLFSFWESPCVYWRRWHSLHCIGLSKNAQLLIAAFIKLSSHGDTCSMNTDHQQNRCCCDHMLCGVQAAEL